MFHKTLIKKSQAALEFLTTYGWAFIVILIMIAALSYFGILSPSKILPDRCSFSPEVNCMSYVIADNGVQLMLKNSAGEPITVDSIAVSTEKSQLICASSIVGTAWAVEEVKDVPIICDFSNAGFSQGEKGKLNLKLTYYPSRSSKTYSRDVNGELYATVKGGTIEGGTLTLTGLVGYWKFDEGSGTTASDSSGNGNNGNLVNGPTWVAGKKGSALSFDGVDDYVSPGSTGLPTNNNDGTWEFWVFPQAADVTSQGIFDSATDITGNRDMRIFVNTNTAYRFGMGWVTDYTVDVDDMRNKWSHIVVTRTSGGVWNAYFNGALKRTVTDTNTWNQYGANIGRFTNGAEYSYFNGIIDEVKIFNRALTSAEVLVEYNS